MPGPRQLFLQFKKAAKANPKRIMLSSQGKELSYAEALALVEKSAPPKGRIHSAPADSSPLLLVEMLRAWAADAAFLPFFENTKPPKKVAAGTALLLSTSGSTGEPKLVPLSAHAILKASKNAAKEQKIGKNSRILATLRFCHSGGIFIQTLPALFSGASLVSVGDSLHASLREPGLTHTILVPTQVEMLARSEQWKDLDLSSFRCIVTGSADTRRAIPLLLEKKAKVLNVYGCSESCSFSVTEWFKKSAKPGPGGALAAGKTQPGVKLKLTHGNIFLDGFDTGDLGEIRNGKLYVLGRKDARIRSASVSVHAAEIESVILEFPGVKECKVQARRHYLLGEIAEAFVSASESSPSFRRELRAFCVKKLGRAKAPKKFHFTKNALPKSANEKILSRALS